MADNPGVVLFLLCLCWPGLVPVVVFWLIGRFYSIDLSRVIRRRDFEL